MITLGTALAIAAVQAALQGGASYMGSRAASRQNAKNEEIVKEQEREAERQRIKAGNNYLDTVEGKTAARIASERMRDVEKAVNDNAIKRGGTTAQRLAQIGSYQDAYNNLISRLAAQGTEYNKYYDGLLSKAKDRYAQQMIGVNEAKAQSGKNAWDNVSAAIGRLGQAGLQLAGDYAYKTTPAKSPTQNWTPLRKSSLLSTPPIKKPQPSFEEMMRRIRLRNYDF